MSTNSEEKELKEPLQTAEETAAKEEQKEEKKEEKKGFLKKDPKKEKIAQLEKEVDELNGKLAKEKDDYIRLMAEFDNFRRRTSQEKLEIVSMASTETIKGLLPVLDDCERALNVLKDSKDSDAAKEGTELIYHKLLAYLQSKGLAVIEALGQPFTQTSTKLSRSSLYRKTRRRERYSTWFRPAIHLTAKSYVSPR